MEQMTEQQFQLWILQHGGEIGRTHNYRSTGGGKDEDGVDTPTSRVIDSTTVVAKDGAKITVKRNPGSSGFGGSEEVPDYAVESKQEPPEERAAAQRTPEQAAADAANAKKGQLDNAQTERERDERWWNQNKKAEGGSGLPETHLERSTREAKEDDAKRLQQQADTAAANSKRASDAQDEQNRQTELTRAENARQHNQSAGLTQQQIDISRAKEEREANKPNFLSTADSKNPYVVSAGPDGRLTSVDNPNYDAVKAAAEEKRAELAAQISARKMNLDEAQAAYTQWFDKNVKTPLMLAQEARAKAEEQRQALEAEERRRQFAADFGLRKATLGESAAQRATNAEISLLPYRAGPTEAAEMSSAINSLAAGGSMANNASAGINFTPGAFQFNAPDFAGIAKKAAKAVLGGLTDYRPSDQSFATGDYSGVPAVNISGAPAMPSVGGAYSLPAPSEDALSY